MKKQKLLNQLMLGILAFVAISLTTTDTFAQRGQGKGYCQNIPDLTDDQIEQIDNLRVDHLKEMTAMRNQIRIVNAELNALQTGDNVDIKAVNQKIDEKTTLKAKILKSRNAHRMEIRNTLNDEQKVFFDNQGNGLGNRNGRCKGQKWGKNSNKQGQYGNRGGKGQQRGMRSGCPYYESDNN